MLWDDLLTKTNAAWLVLSGIAVAAVRLLVNARAQISDLSAKLAKDRAGERVLAVETTLQTGWMQGLVKARDDLQDEVNKLEERIESLRESQLNDARQIAKKDAEADACHERVQEARLDRQLAIDDMIKTREQLAAAMEHAIILEGQMLNLKYANARIFAELDHAKAMAMVDLLVKPGPSKP